MTAWRTRWRAELDQLAAQHRYRQRRVVSTPDGNDPIRVRVDGHDCLNFCSNDYLGLRVHPKVVAALQAAVQQYGAGSGAAHLVTGHHPEHHALEEALADWLQRDRVLLFSTGYMANLGIASALLQRGDRVLEDRLSHASMLDAGRLSGARFSRFAHNDVGDLMAHLSTPMTASQGQTLVMCEGIYSMDGDASPLASLAAACSNASAMLMVDDAHGLGVVGPEGRGSVLAANLGSDEVPIYMATLGKALGVAGAFVAGPDELIELLIQKARTYIYTTAMPAALAAATRASLAVLQAEPERVRTLQQHIQRLRAGLMASGWPVTASQSAIQPLIVGSDAAAVALSQALLVRGFMVSAIRPPTVPEGTARLRITLSAAHAPEHIDALLTALTEARAELSPMIMAGTTS